MSSHLDLLQWGVWTLFQGRSTRRCASGAAARFTTSSSCGWRPTWRGTPPASSAPTVISTSTRRVPASFGMARHTANATTSGGCACLVAAAWLFRRPGAPLCARLCARPLSAAPCSAVESAPQPGPSDSFLLKHFLDAWLLSLWRKFVKYSEKNCFGKFAASNHPGTFVV